MAGDICDCCGRPEVLGVASSGLGAVSFAWCRECLTEEAEPYDLTKIKYKPASEDSVRTVLKAPVNSLNGRSNWLLFRLPNGDVIFGCFPEGDTYFDVEGDAP